MRLDIHALKVHVGERLLMDGLDLHVIDGHFVGLVGPNGSGKSTLIRTIARILRPDGGVILLDDVPTAEMSTREVARSIAVVHQDSPTDVEMTVFEMVMLGRMPHQRALAGTSRHDEELVTDALARVAATHLAGRAWSTLSGGERQRCLLARALAQTAPVLLLDEPTNHLDIRHQLDLLAMSRALGVTTIGALHDLNLAARYCDEVIVLRSGEIVAFGPALDVLRHDVLSPVFGVGVDRVTHPRTGEIQLLFTPLEERHLEDHPTSPSPARGTAARHGSLSSSMR